MGENSSVCRMCGLQRKRCSCLRRIGCKDPFHETFGAALSHLTETRFYGKAAYTETLKLVDEGRTAFYAGRTSFPLGEPQRVDRDAERLKAKAFGKLYGTVQKLSERGERPNRQPPTSSIELLRRRFGV